MRLADSRPRVDLETLFPKQCGDWHVDTRLPVQLVSPDTQAMLAKIYNQTLERTYIEPNGGRVMLSVAYGGDQSDATRAHRPEVCYPAQGFAVRDQSAAAITVAGNELRARRLVAVLGGRIEPITYWIVVGEQVATSGTQQKLAQLSYGAQGIVADGMLVRVSSIDADSGHAYAIHQRFLDALGTALPSSQRARVMGTAA